MIQLTHPFKDKCPDVLELFKKYDGEDIVTIDDFCYRLNTLSEKYKDVIDPNEYKGWGLEIFVEYMIKEGGSDNRIGIYNYTPILGNDDVGVDGLGTGENKKPATVQVKFRQANYILTANEDHLSNFLASSVMDYDVDKNDDKNMLIVTTGKEVHYNTMEKMLKNKVRQLHREHLKELFDNRETWWKGFYISFIESRTKAIQFSNVPKIKLRTHQIEAVQEAINDENQKGMVILPTGTGKTLIEAEIIRQKILSAKEAGNLSPIIKVNTSRILLCFQLFEEMYKYLSSYGIDARYANFNSGNKSDSDYAEEVRKQGGIYREIVSTTSAKSILETHEKCIKEKIPLIVFSTYHSSCKLDNIESEVTIHDESHNLVSSQFFNALDMSSKSNFFFTATMKTSDSEDGIGMNNTDYFDNIMYNRSAKDMIDCGEMVPPYVHFVNAIDEVDEVDEADYDSMFNSIIESFFTHERKIKQHSAEPNKIGAKVLVVCRNQDDLMKMFESNTFSKFKKRFPEIYLYGLSSNFGIYKNGEMLNGSVTNMKKHDLIQELKNLEYHEKCIIFHVDMIGEGIDVPGITGVMPFRNCELSKFIQNVGRSTRLHPLDRKRLYDGTIGVDKRNDFIKPCSWIIIPTFLTQSFQYKDRFDDILTHVRNEFGYIPMEITHIDNNGGIVDDEDIDVVNSKRKKKEKKKKSIIEFEHEFDDLPWSEQLIVNQIVDDKSNSIIKELLS